MARLTRKNMKVFAANASNNGVFGSLEAGNPTVTNDVEQIQGLTAWGDGWNAATLSAEKLPPLEEFQGVQYVTTYQQAYIMQEGLPEWASSVTYFHGSLVKKVTANGFQIYNSLTDNNEGNQLTDTTNWKLVMDSDNLYAMDNAVVHLAGAETITGAKTFTGSNYVKDQFLHYTTDRIAYTETPTDSNVYWGLNCLDKNDAEVSAIYSAYYTDGRGLTGFNLKNHAGDTAKLSLRFNDSGTFYTEAPTPTDTTTTSGTQIATTGWVNTVGNNVVHRTGDESITGRKNFVGGYNNVRLSCTTNDTTGNNNYTDIAFYNNSGSTKNAYIRANNLGNLYLSATDAVTAPASDKADSILITVAKSKAQNGYFKLGNGLIIQWGRTQINVVTGGSHTPTTITLPIAFSGTNFSFTGTFEQDTSTSPSNTDDVSFCTTSITTTNVKGFGYDSGGNTYKAYLRWIAIGY